MSRPAEHAGVRYTYAEYEGLERDSPNVRHEYLAGQVYAMSGASPEHERLVTDLILAVGPQLEHSDCRIFGSNLRVRVITRDLYTYPDASIVCGLLELDETINPPALLNPLALFEVTSDSTEAYDRGDKFDHYRQIPSLRSVVFLSHAEPLIEVWTWPSADPAARTAEVARSGERARIRARDIDLDVDRIYTGWRALRATG
jgi:Uma2 family endonuclease